MKKLFLVLGVIGLFVLTFTLAFSYGRKIEKDVIPIKLATIQAMLAFNHLQRYRELESDLSKGSPARRNPIDFSPRLRAKSFSQRIASAMRRDGRTSTGTW